MLSTNVIWRCITLYKSLIKFKVVAKDIVCEYMLQIMCFFMVYDDPFTSKEQILTIAMKLFAYMN